MPDNKHPNDTTMQFTRSTTTLRLVLVVLIASQLFYHFQFLVDVTCGSVKREPTRSKLLYAPPPIIQIKQPAVAAKITQTQFTTASDASATITTHEDNAHSQELFTDTHDATTTTITATTIPHAYAYNAHSPSTSSLSAARKQTQLTHTSDTTAATKTPHAYTYNAPSSQSTALSTAITATSEPGT